MSQATASLVPWADPAFVADPYPHYRRLREQAPVYRDPLGIWLLSRYDDVTAAARDPRLGKDFSVVDGNRVTAVRGGPDAPLVSEFSRWMLYKDPPDHMRLRSLVTRAFTPRTVERMRKSIENVVSELLATVAGSGRMDVMAEFAYILPVRVICSMLGLPLDESDRCREWADAISRGLEPLQSQESVGRANASIVEISRYVRGHIDRRRNRPGDDLLSDLLAVEEAGDRLTEAELVSTVNLLFFAGHLTTRDLIGNGLLALLHNPNQLRRLRTEPAVARNAVDELLRYDGPVQMTPRWALEDLEIGGCAIARNDHLSLLLGAANRDPGRFADPDRLDLGRADAAAHASFGGGAHFCLGAALSRLEARIAIPALAGLPGLELEDAEPDWRPQVALRSLKALHVTFRPHARAPRPARTNQGGRAAPRSSDPCPVVVRDATPDDYDAASALMVAAFRDYRPVPMQPDVTPVWDAWIADAGDVRSRMGHAELLVAECAGEIAGAVTLYADGSLVKGRSWPRRWAVVRLLAVLPEWRGRGIDRALAQECVRRARLFGVEAVGLHADSRKHLAEGLYLQMGFCRLPRYDVPVVDGIVMKAFRLELGEQG